jgi:hypothetical protein
MSMAFRNSEYSTARKGRFDDIKNTISYSLQAAWENTGMAFTLEAYEYYQFVHFTLRIDLLTMVPAPNCNKTPCPVFELLHFLYSVWHQRVDVLLPPVQSSG